MRWDFHLSFIFWDSELEHSDSDSPSSNQLINKSFATAIAVQALHYSICHASILPQSSRIERELGGSRLPQQKPACPCSSVLVIWCQIGAGICIIVYSYYTIHAIDPGPKKQKLISCGWDGIFPFEFLEICYFLPIFFRMDSLDTDGRGGRGFGLGKSCSDRVYVWFSRLLIEYLMLLLLLKTYYVCHAMPRFTGINPTRDSNERRKAGSGPLVAALPMLQLLDARKKFL